MLPFLLLERVHEEPLAEALAHVGVELLRQAECRSEDGDVLGVQRDGPLALVVLSREDSLDQSSAAGFGILVVARMGLGRCAVGAHDLDADEPRLHGFEVPRDASEVRAELQLVERRGQHDLEVGVQHRQKGQPAQGEVLVEGRRFGDGSALTGLPCEGLEELLSIRRVDLDVGVHDGLLTHC